MHVAKLLHNLKSYYFILLQKNSLNAKSFLNNTMEKPIQPNRDECCNSGCNPCIFDVYEKQLKVYEKYLKNENLDKFQDNAIAQLEYTTFVVVNSIQLSNSHKLLALKRETENGKKVWWNPGDHFIVKCSINDILYSRAYTPVTIRSTNLKYDFAIIVKKYAEGLVSTYLFNLNVGQGSLWRGPYGQYEMTPNKFDRIIMFAQGTGIAPFITIIENILNNEDDMTKIVLLYCCKCIDTILFRDELCDYKSYWNFSYEIYITASFTNAKIRYKEPIKNGRLSIEDIYKFNPFGSKDQILLCGSAQFQQHYKGFFIKQFDATSNIILF